MINVSLTVREAILIASKCDEYGGDEGRNLRDRIIRAMELAMVDDTRCSVTITKGMVLDNRLPCIKAIRKHTGWGLKETKEWTDVITGHYSTTSGHWVPGGNDNTLTVKNSEAAESLLRELVGLGCEGFIS